MRYARRLVQLLEADLDRERARIAELNATIETLRAERNDREAAEERVPIIPAAVAELADREEIARLSHEYRSERDKLLAERDKHPPHHAAYHSGRRAVLQAMRSAVAGVNARFAAPEALIERINEAIDIEEGQTEYKFIAGQNRS